MKPHIEKEYKMMISEKEYNQIISDFNALSFLQSNYYYSTGYKDKACRIRYIDNKYIFTLKVSKKDYKEEYEFQINDNSLDDKRIQELLKEFNINDLEYEGYMDTYRTVIKLENGELCIDKSLYNNQIDYELEYELLDPDKDTFGVFESILSRYNLTYKKSEKSKYKRFLDSKY